MRQRINSVRHVLLVLAGLWLSSTRPDSAAPSLQANHIVAAMAQRYAMCHTYQDEGTVTSSSPTDAHIVAVNRFKTWFSRPDRLRFQWTNVGKFDRPDNFACLSWNGTRADFFCLGKHEHTELDNAIAAATGVSRGAAHTVARMLLPDTVTGLSLTTCQFDPIVAPEQMDHVPCYVIAGRLPDSPLKLKMWVGQHDSLLRQFRLVHPDYVEVEKHTHVLVNTPVIPEVFTNPTDRP